MTRTSFLIMLGVLLSFLLTAVLYRKRTGSITAVLAFYPMAFILSVLFCRFLHWYSAGQLYKSLFQALFNLKIGTYSGAGIVIGTCLAGWITAKLGFCKSRGKLMDCFAPGFLLLFLFIRLSAWGTGRCQGGKNITAKLLHFFPVCVKGTDAAGSTYWRFATFAFEAVLLLIAFLFVLKFYAEEGTRHMKKPARRFGNVWKWALTLFSAMDIVLDSTRIDSLHFTFRKILTLNRFSSFVSIGQVIPAVVLLCVFVYYLKNSVKARGFRGDHALALAAFVLGLVLIGYFGEYKWQRLGKYWSYLSMAAGSGLIVYTVRQLMESCVKRTRPRPEE